MSEESSGVEACLQRLRRGELAARDELIAFAFERLQRMTRKLKRDFDRVGRWEQTEDIAQNATMRLYDALAQVTIEDTRHFYRLAALQIRRELIDLCRHYQGPQGIGANHHTQRGRPEADAERSQRPPEYEVAEYTNDPRKMQQWADFHECVETLPAGEKEVFEMLWYHELPQEEVARLIGLSTRQVKRIWRTAKLRLHDQLGGNAGD
jgi:RNA polymerase sigma-70 factor (ECF subfamily)